MFDNNSLDQLHKMYKIFIRVKDTKKFIIEKFKQFILKEGTLIITNKEFIGGKAEAASPNKPKPGGPGPKA